MARVVLLLGGNEDETRQAFSSCRDMVGESVGAVISLSHLYTSPPWGFDHPHWFLNQVVVLESILEPLEILAVTQDIEQRLGRKTKTKTSKQYEARIIDIDILFVDNTILHHPELQIPHPRLHLRRFTLEPLIELMPGFVHPVLRKTMKDLLNECPDQNAVKRII